MKSTRLTSDGKIKISINVPERLLLELDTDRELNHQDRSIWITSAIMEKLATIKTEKNKDMKT